MLKQVVPSIAMVETYVRVLLVAPHALFRSLMTVFLFPVYEILLAFTEPMFLYSDTFLLHIVNANLFIYYFSCDIFSTANIPYSIIRNDKRSINYKQYP